MHEAQTIPAGGQDPGHFSHRDPLTFYLVHMGSDGNSYLHSLNTEDIQPNYVHFDINSERFRESGFSVLLLRCMDLLALLGPCVSPNLDPESENRH